MNHDLCIYPVNKSIMDEIYAYLGKNDDVHYFIHTIINPTAFKTTISCNVYNVMIHESRIADPSISVIIFEVDPFKGDISLVITQHADKEGGPDEFDSRSVASLLTPLSKAPRSGMYVIKHNYQNGVMESYELPNMSIPTSKLPDGGPTIADITYFVTKMPFV